MRLSVSTVAAALVCVLEHSAPNGALAQRYAVTCVQNRTALDFNYSYRWGGAPWQQAVVPAHADKEHSFPYDEAYQAAPVLEVMFDFDPTDRVSYRNYTLQKTIARRDDCSAGKKYYFGYSSSGEYDLFDPDIVPSVSTSLPPPSVSTSLPRPSVSTSLPPQVYALTCIENRTDLSLNYIFRWGSYDWQTYSVRPGASIWHYWPYPRDAQQAPIPQVKFNYDLTIGSETYQYDLTSNTAQVQSCDPAKKYYFARKGDRRIDLFDPDKPADRPHGKRGKRDKGRVTVGIPR